MYKNKEKTHIHHTRWIFQLSKSVVTQNLPNLINVISLQIFKGNLNREAITYRNIMDTSDTVVWAWENVPRTSLQPLFLTFQTHLPLIKFSTNIFSIALWSKTKQTVSKVLQRNWTDNKKDGSASKEEEPNKI